MSSRKKGKSLARKSHKFVSKAAEHRFENLKSTPLIYKRGFKMEKRAWSLAYTLQIRKLRWETLCHPQCEAVIPWVYEFYANAKQMEGEMVTVRGKLINISARAINELYDLGNQEELEILNHQVEPEEVVAEICNYSEPEWSKMSMKALKSTSLSREAKFLILFINAGIMPTRHLNNITLDRAVLIYNIVKVNRVNVGKIISSHLKMKIQEDKSLLLWFPILITKLYRRARVACATEDLITQVRRQISEQVVQVNIKVGVEIDSGFKTSYKRIRSVASSSSAGKLEKLVVPSGEGATLSKVMDSIEFIKL
ncbi:hypothetical protein KSP40_PGU005730 [Platanthera guangdongensis]|uniref:Putative plant transposon protein domain-containing protein n=1 Tax=Platanthera guangdongensis TaxID=2320717 RepID=A0ABR2MZX9_9ASPA